MRDREDIITVSIEDFVNSRILGYKINPNLDVVYVHKKPTKGLVDLITERIKTYFRKAKAVIFRAMVDRGQVRYFTSDGHGDCKPFLHDSTCYGCCPLYV